MKHKINKLNKILSDRSNYSSHIFAFLRSMHNVQKNCYLINSLNDRLIIKSSSLELAIMQSIVFSVRALETLMRDSYVYCLENIKGFEESILQKSKITTELTEQNIQFQDKYHFHEYLASLKNFQNLDVINKSFRPLYDKNFLVVAKEYIAMAFTYEEKEVSMTQMSMDIYSHTWKADLKKLYAERHEIIHNANHKTSLNFEECYRLMNTALMFGQMTGIIIGSRNGSESTGTVAIKAPLYKVMVWHHYLKHGSPSLEELFEKVKEKSDEKKLGSIGPFVFIGGADILQCDFGEDSFRNKDLVIHSIEILENGTLKVSNLTKI